MEAPTPNESASDTPRTSERSVDPDDASYLEGLNDSVGRILRSPELNFSPEQQAINAEVERLCTAVIDQVEATPRIDLPPKVAQQLLRIAGHLHVARTEANLSAPTQKQARRHWLIETLLDITRNEYEDDHKRRAANAFNLTVRTAIGSSLCFLLRETLSFEVAKSKAVTGDTASLAYIGYGVITANVAFHLLALADSYKSKNMRARNVIARVGLTLFALGAFGMCFAARSADEVASRMPHVALYCAMRDIVNFIFPLSNNVVAMSKWALVGAGAAYGLYNFIAGIGIDQAFPPEGEGALQSFNATTATTPFAMAAIAAAGINWPQTIWTSLGYGAVEAAEEATTYSLLLWRGYDKTKKSFDKTGFDEDSYAEMSRKIIEFANVLLDTPTSKRFDAISKFTSRLYRLEVTRLTEKNTRVPLDGVELKVFEVLTMWRDERAKGTPFDRQLNPVAPPSFLVHGTTEQTPDFVQLDKTLRKILDEANQGAKEGLGLKKKQIREIVRDLYVNAFVETYMPIPVSRLQSKLLLRVLAEHPRLLPQLVLPQLTQRVQAERIAPSKKLRITASFNPPKGATDLLKGLEPLLHVSTLRFDLYLWVYGVLFSLAAVIEENVMDETTRSVLNNLLVFVAISLALPWLYYSLAPVHDNRRLPSSTGGRITTSSQYYGGADLSPEATAALMRARFDDAQAAVVGFRGDMAKERRKKAASNRRQRREFRKNRQGSGQHDIMRPVAEPHSSGSGPRSKLKSGSEPGMESRSRSRSQSQSQSLSKSDSPTESRSSSGSASGGGKGLPKKKR